MSFHLGRLKIFLCNIKKGRKIENSGKSDFCKINAPRVSYAKHIRSNKLLGKSGQKNMITPDWFFQGNNRNLKRLPRGTYNSETLKQIAEERNKIEDYELIKEIAKKMNNPNYFSDRILNTASNINQNSHHNNHLNSNITTEQYFLDFKKNYVNEILKKLATIYARLMNHYEFNCQLRFSMRFDEQDEDDQVLDEVEANRILMKVRQSQVLRIYLLDLNQNNRFRIKKQRIVVGDLIKLSQ